MIKTNRIQSLDRWSRGYVAVVSLIVFTSGLSSHSSAQSLIEFPTGEAMQQLGNANEIGAFLTRKLADPLPNKLMRGGSVVAGTYGTYIESAEKYPETEHRVLRTAFVEGTSTIAGGIAVVASPLCGPAAPGCAVVGSIAVKTVTSDAAGMIYDANSTSVMNRITDARTVHGHAVSLALPEPIRGAAQGTSSAYANREAAAVEQRRQEEARRQREAERRYAQEQQRLLDQQRRAQTTLMNGFAQGLAQAIAGGIVQGALNGGAPSSSCCDGYPAVQPPVVPSIDGSASCARLKAQNPNAVCMGRVEMPNEW